MLEVAKRFDEEDSRLAAERHRRLMAAVDQELGGNQSELYRRLVVVEPKLALPTVQAWCRGPKPHGTGKPITELTLRAILVVLGLPPDWKPKAASSTSKAS